MSLPDATGLFCGSIKDVARDPIKDPGWKENLRRAAGSPGRG